MEKIMAVGLMDVNLTGALAANVNLLQPSTSIDWLQILGAVVPAIVAALAALGGVWLQNSHNDESKRIQLATDKEKKWFEDRQYAYQKFLDVMSEPYFENTSSNKREITPEDEFKRYSSKLLKAATDLVRFGNFVLKEDITVKKGEDDYAISTLNTLIIYLYLIRMGNYPLDAKIKYVKDIRSLGTDAFLPIVLRTLSNESPSINIVN